MFNKLSASAKVKYLETTHGKDLPSWMQDEGSGSYGFKFEEPAMKVSKESQDVLYKYFTGGFKKNVHIVATKKRRARKRRNTLSTLGAYAAVLGSSAFGSGLGYMGTKAVNHYLARDTWGSANLKRF